MAYTGTPADEALDRAVESLLSAIYMVETEPTTAQLLDYDLGLATAEEARLVEQALAIDPLIRQEIAQLQALNQQRVTPATIPFAGRFLAWLRAQWPDQQPLLALAQPSPMATPALRGNGAAHTVYTVGPYRLALTVRTADQPPGDSTDHYTIQGQLLNQEVPDDPCHGTVQLIAVLPDEEQSSEPTVSAATPLDEFGFFTLQLLHAGSYRLVAVLAHYTIWIQAIDVS